MTKVKETLSEMAKDLYGVSAIDNTQLLKILSHTHQNAHILNKPPQLLKDFSGILKNSPSFNSDPLEIQQTMRDDWN